MRKRKASQSTMRKWWNEPPPAPIHSMTKGDIVCCDALQFLRCLKPGSADLVFLDPPFNLGKRYGRNGSGADRLSQTDYRHYMTTVIELSVRVLRDGGALYLYHLPQWAIRLSATLEKHLTFRHWIAVSMKAGFVRGRRLYPAHYSLLYYTKGDPAHFDRPKVYPPLCPHCNNYIRDYGGYERFVRNGMNLSDIWDDVSPVRHRKYKHRGPNELPLEIPLRAAQISGPRGGLLVDPFAGSGTALVAATRAGMRFVGCDTIQSYCKIMVRRLSAGTHSS